MERGSFRAPSLRSSTSKPRTPRRAVRCGSTCSASTSSSGSPRPTPRSTNRSATCSPIPGRVRIDYVNDDLWLAPLDPGALLGARRTRRSTDTSCSRSQTPTVEPCASRSTGTTRTRSVPRRPTPPTSRDDGDTRRALARRESLDRVRGRRSRARAPTRPARVRRRDVPHVTPARAAHVLLTAAFGDRTRAIAAPFCRRNPGSAPAGAGALDHAERARRPAEAVHHQLVDLARASRCLRRRRAALRAPSRSRRGSRRSPTPSGCPSRRSGSCRTARAASVTVVDRLLARLRRHDDLRELHHRRGRRPVPADHAVGPVGRRRERGDRQARRVRREDRRRRARSRSRSRNTSIFRSRRSGTASITRSVAAASSNDAVNVMRASAASASSRVSFPRSTALSSPKRPVVTCSRACVERVGRDVVAQRLVARDRGHLRDPAAHDTGTEHSDPHRDPRNLSRRAARCGRARARAPRARPGSAPSARPSHSRLQAVERRLRSMTPRQNADAVS